MMDIRQYLSPKEENQGPRGNLFQKSFGKSRDEIVITKTSVVKEDIQSDYDNYLDVEGGPIRNKNINMSDDRQSELGDSPSRMRSKTYKQQPINILSIDNLHQYKQEDMDLPSQRFTRNKDVEINHIHNEQCKDSCDWDHTQKSYPQAKKTIEITSEILN